MENLILMHCFDVLHDNKLAFQDYLKRIRTTIETVTLHYWNAKSQRISSPCPP